jgi:hypothetical protein
LLDILNTNGNYPITAIVVDIIHGLDNPELPQPFTFDIHDPFVSIQPYRDGLIKMTFIGKPDDISRVINAHS